MRRFLIVGAGFSGAVVAEQLSLDRNNEITIVDERSHIGGNCFTERDELTNIQMHIYGPHIFNTNDSNLWNYLNHFGELVPYVNRVKTIYHGDVYSMPINLHTINQFFRKALSPLEAKAFIGNLGDKTILTPNNFEEQAMKMLGSELYHAFFYGYTKKQWGCEPDQLPASILSRLPIRFNYNDNYYNSNFQGIPRDGYTSIFHRMLDKKNIDVQLNTRFESDWNINEYEQVFYTGPIDSFFNYQFGRLGYRTVYFEKHIADDDYQGNAVINYSDENVPYTRIHEHKHFTPWESHEKTVYFKEYSKETEFSDIPYYPKRLGKDIELLHKYEEEKKKLTKYTFLGRLATYRYMDMQHVIAEALNIVQNFKIK